MKVFSETLSVVNKCFPSIPSRKRSRPDSLPGDRASGLLLNRSPMGAGVGKMGTQSHSPAHTFDFEQPKVEERGKSAIPNKRTRTSLVDQRVRFLHLIPFSFINCQKISLYNFPFMGFSPLTSNFSYLVESRSGFCMLK